MNMTKAEDVVSKLDLAGIMDFAEGYIRDETGNAENVVEIPPNASIPSISYFDLDISRPQIDVLVYFFPVQTALRYEHRTGDTVRILL